MKTTLFAIALVITLSLSAAASQKKPAMHVNPAGDASAKTPEFKANPLATPPSLCNPCLFYGGDLNPSDRNADAFSDGNTLLITGGSATYGTAEIPSGPNANITGIVVNVLATAAFDPFTGAYDIRQGISEGNGGTSVASGSGDLSVVATGVNAFGLYQYTIAVSFPTITLVPGQYWFNLQPQCTNTLDGSCSVFVFYASNTTQKTNAVNGSWQHNSQMFFNSSYFGADWANWCDSTFFLTPQQCGDLSFGLVGELQ